MILKKLKKIYPIGLAFVLSFAINSCVDDPMPQNSEPDGSEVPQNGYALNFKINLETMTREGNISDFEKYEDYIDPSKIHILFFFGDKTHNNYNTLIKKFAPNEFSLIPVNNTGSSNSSEWYVSIPITENREEFGRLLRNENFKIAVLANWPSSEIDLREYDVATQTLGDKIHKLHHQPAPKGQGSDTYISESTYDFLLEDSNPKNMGVFTNWVKDGKKTDAAKDFIKNYYGPGQNISGTDENGKPINPTDAYGQYKYDELWQRWNFSDAYYYLPSDKRPSTGYNYTPSLTDDSSITNEDFPEKWAEKNYTDLYNWFWKGQTDKVKITDGTHLDNFGDLGSGYFQFIQTDLIGGRESYLKLNESSKRAGIVLQPGDKDNNVIRIKIPNNGELKIKYGSHDGLPATIKCEARNHEGDSQAKSDSNASFNISVTANDTDTETTRSDKEVKITGDAEYLFIYAQVNPVVIYEIEYISSYYYHNIDNVGKALSKEDGILIPMYGIQSFSALGTLWKEGTVFDLSNFNSLGTVDKEQSDGSTLATANYGFKSVSLLRSIAKVELKIPKIFKAHHVFLRCMNKKGRCEPVDVSTPTDEIWDKTVTGEITSHGDACHDWSKIFGHTPFYLESSDDNAKTQWDNYRNKLAWYYGSWATVSDSQDNSGKTVGEVTIEHGNSAEGQYPQIMNAMIERTDFVEFIEAGSDSYYDRYILYVPEKYVDDPGSVGDDKSMETTTPKICHIEFREDRDPYTNIDDNYCDRIYFTEGGFFSNNGTNHYPRFGKIKDSNGNDIDDNWENTYEKNVTNLQNHWPIIRNHYYRFTVVDAKNRMVITKLEVLPWRMIEDNRYAW